MVNRHVVSLQLCAFVIRSFIPFFFVTHCIIFFLSISIFQKACRCSFVLFVFTPRYLIYILQNCKHCDQIVDVAHACLPKFCGVMKISSQTCHFADSFHGCTKCFAGIVDSLFLWLRGQASIAGFCFFDKCRRVLRCSLNRRVLRRPSFKGEL